MQWPLVCARCATPPFWSAILLLGMVRISCFEILLCQVEFCFACDKTNRSEKSDRTTENQTHTFSCQMLVPCARLGTSHKQISRQDLTRPMAEILVDTVTEDFFTHLSFSHILVIRSLNTQVFSDVMIKFSLSVTSNEHLNVWPSLHSTIFWVYQKLRFSVHQWNSMCLATVFIFYLKVTPL